MKYLDPLTPINCLLVNNLDETNFEFEVYRKPTNLGLCMNGNSECPSRYKRSVINSFLIRANKNSSCEARFQEEINHTRKKLERNNYNLVMMN